MCKLQKGRVGDKEKENGRWWEENKRLEFYLRYGESNPELRGENAIC